MGDNEDIDGDSGSDLADEFTVTPLRRHQLAPSAATARVADGASARLPRPLRRWFKRMGVCMLLAVSIVGLAMTQLLPLSGSDQQLAPPAGDEFAIQIQIPWYPTPPERTPAALGAAPRSCSAAPLRAFNPNDAFVGVGQDPIWVGFFFSHARAPAILHPYQPPSAADARFGFPVPLLIETVPGASEPITLMVADSTRGTPLWFVPDPNSRQEGPTIELVIDPRDPHILLETNGWKSWNVTLYLPRSGCYELHAVWRSGSWRATVAGGA
jgi:hypothetical protein